MKLSKNNIILIIGLGLIGGSYAKGLSDKGYYVGGLTKDQTDIDYAFTHNFIKEGRTTIDENFIKQFDILIFALYPRTLISWLKENQNFIKEGALLTDVTGVKKEVVNQIKSFLRSDLRFVGAHPMAGKEVSGLVNADPNIFTNANYIVTPTSDNAEEDIELVEDIGHTLGFKNVSRLSIEKHDEMIGFLSQLTHCIAISLMTCQDTSHLYKYSGDSFRDLTRIAKINENMWPELFSMNKDELLRQMDLFSNEFNRLKLMIENDDISSMKELMKESTLRRKNFDK